MATQKIEPAELMAPLVEEVERHGQPPRLVYFDLANEKGEDFQRLVQGFPEADAAAIRSSLKAARANEYLEPTALGPGASLRLTTRGFYAGQSQRQAAEKAKNETGGSRAPAGSGWTKRANDWFVANTGLIAGATLVAAVIGLILAGA